MRTGRYTENKKDSVIRVRVDDYTKSVIDSVAEESHMSVSDVIRWCIKNSLLENDE